MDFGDNVWDVDWGEPGEYEAEAEAAGFGGVRGKRLRRQLGRRCRRPSGSSSRARGRRPTTSTTAARSS